MHWLIFLCFLAKRYQCSATGAPQFQSESLQKVNSLPVVTSWVRDEKWKIPKELWGEDSCLYTNPTTLLLHCKSLTVLKLSLCSLALTQLLKQVENSFFFLMLNQLLLYQKLLSYG